MGDDIRPFRNSDQMIAGYGIQIFHNVFVYFCCKKPSLQLKLAKYIRARGGLSNLFLCFLPQHSFHDMPLTRTNSRMLSKDFEAYRIQQVLHLTCGALHGRIDRHHKQIRLCSHRGRIHIRNQLFMYQKS